MGDLSGRARNTEEDTFEHVWNNFSWTALYNRHPVVRLTVFKSFFFLLFRISESCFVEELQKSNSSLSSSLRFSLPQPPQTWTGAAGREGEVSGVRWGKLDEMWCLLTEHFFHMSLPLWCQTHPSRCQSLPLFHSRSLSLRSPEVPAADRSVNDLRRAPPTNLTGPLILNGVFTSSVM